MPVEQAPLHSGDGDVYDSAAVLDAAYDAEAAATGTEPYVLCIEVQDVPGVLNQVGLTGGAGVGVTLVGGAGAG